MNPALFQKQKRFLLNVALSAGQEDLGKVGGAVVSEYNLSPGRLIAVGLWCRETCESGKIKYD